MVSPLPEPGEPEPGASDHPDQPPTGRQGPEEAPATPHAGAEAIAPAVAPEHAIAALRPALTHSCATNAITFLTSGSSHAAHSRHPQLLDALGLVGRACARRDLDQRPNLVGDHVDDRRLALELPVDEQQGVAPDHAAEASPGIGPQGDVDHPGLVLEGEEDRALGGHRVLAGPDP